MAVTVELPEELEQSVRDAAARAGLDEAQFLRNILIVRLKQDLLPIRRLDGTESDLIQRINEGLTASEWERFHTLVLRRQEEQLTECERVELTALTDRIETLNVRRIELLIELSRRRGHSLQRVMDDLGLRPPPYA